MAAPTQPEHFERPLVVLMDSIKDAGGTVTLLAPLGATDTPRQDRAARGARHTIEHAGQIPIVLATTCGGRRTVPPDLVGVARLPFLDVGAMALCVGALPGSSPVLVALLA
jgi:hypothetical protein